MSDIEKRTQEVLRLYEKHGPNNYPGDILDLVKQGVDVDASNMRQETLLHYSAWCYLHEDICAELIQQHADIHARDDNGYTPMHLAVLNVTSKTVKYLPSRGANIWAKDNKGKTVLDCDDTGSLESYREQWEEVLGEIKNKEYKSVNTTQDLYHLASVMKPLNPKDIPPPKEFIRLLFQQYLPHDEKFNAMYAEIFSQQRINAVENLQKLRETARKNNVERVTIY